MKKIFYTLILAVLSFSAHSQVFLNTGAGTSFVQGPKFMGELNIGYNLEGFTLSTGFQALIGPSQPLIVQVRTGKVFYINDSYSIEPSIGYSFLFHSMEQSFESHPDENYQANKSVMAFRLELQRYISDQAQVYVAGCVNGKIPGISVGIKTSF